jgi:hypothetical protein
MGKRALPGGSQEDPVEKDRIIIGQFVDFDHEAALSKCELKWAFDNPGFMRLPSIIPRLFT